MTALIRFFCVSFWMVLAGSEVVELQFLPNEVAEITSSIEYQKEIKFADLKSEFRNSQNVSMDLALNEESQAKFPFSFTLTLNKVQFSGSSLDTIELAELQSLLARPMQFALRSREQSLELDDDQSKLFGGYQLLSSSNFNGLLEEDIRDIFFLADIPLKEGASHTFLKKIGPLELPIAYTIKKISRDAITASIYGKLDRKKLPQATVMGELQGEIVWNRKNNLFFTSAIQAQFTYKFGKESTVKIDLTKNIVSKAK